MLLLKTTHAAQADPDEPYEAVRIAKQIEALGKQLFDLEKRYAELPSTAFRSRDLVSPERQSSGTVVNYLLKQRLTQYPYTKNGKVTGVVTPDPDECQHYQVKRESISSDEFTIRPTGLMQYSKERHDRFNVGDIGWYPVLRPSTKPCIEDICMEYGFICAKKYPIIIVDRLDDCMIGLIISTGQGCGLNYKRDSVRDRSVHVLLNGDTTTPLSPFGNDLVYRRPPRVLEYTNPGYIPAKYKPHEGAFVDLLDSIKIPYDSRFKQEARLTNESRDDLVQMRAAAVLTNCKRTWYRMPKEESMFKEWLDDWRATFEHWKTVE
jgi:hypothetical protein